MSRLPLPIAIDGSAQDDDPVLCTDWLLLKRSAGFTIKPAIF